MSGVSLLAFETASRGWRGQEGLWHREGRWLALGLAQPEWTTAIVGAEGRLLRFHLCDRSCNMVNDRL
jgi:hypothetical protein